MIHPRAVGGLQGGLELEGRAGSAGGQRRQDCKVDYSLILVVVVVVVVILVIVVIIMRKGKSVARYVDYSLKVVVVAVIFDILAVVVVVVTIV